MKFFSPLAAVLLFASVDVYADDASEARMLEGVWRPSQAELAGTKFPGEALKLMKLTLKHGKYTLESAEPTDRGKWTIDASKTPRAMDITGTDGPNNGKTFLCIYQLSGDRLQICYDLSGKMRPTRFETKPKSSLFLVTYERARP